MSTAWPALSANDVVSGEPAETVGRLIFDQQEALTGARCSGLMFTDVSTAAAAYTTIATLRFRVPAYGIAAKKIRFYARCRVLAAATANFRIINGATLGTDSANITSTTFAGFFSDLVIQAGWPSTIIDLTVQGKTSASTVVVGGEQLAANIRILD